MAVHSLVVHARSRKRVALLLVLASFAVLLVVRLTSAGPVVPEATATGRAIFVEGGDALGGSLEAVAVSSSFVAFSDEGRSSDLEDEFGDSFGPTASGRVVSEASAAEAPSERESDAASAAAPSSSEHESTTGGTLDVGNVAEATALSQEAHARWQGSVCESGDLPLGESSGVVTAARIGETDIGHDSVPLLSTTRLDAGRRELSSRSDISVVRRGSSALLRTETRQQFAPVLFTAGTNDPSDDFVVELLGEWVLVVEADGTEGGARVTHYIERADPSSPAIRITSNDQRLVLSVQEVFTAQSSRSYPVHPAFEVTIGRPRRPGDDSSSPLRAHDGTEAMAAVDAVRIKSRESAFGKPLDVRIGHMEASVRIPAGGFRCAAQ